MKIAIVSEHKISDGLKTMAQAIMRQSQCPNESLINSIKDCKGIKDGVIMVGVRPMYVDEVDY